MEDLDYTEQHHIEYALNKASIDFEPNNNNFNITNNKKTTFPCFVKKINFPRSAFSTNQKAPFQNYSISSKYANYNVKFDDFKTFAILNSNFAHVYLKNKNQGRNFDKMQYNYTKPHRNNFDYSFKKMFPPNLRVSKSAANLSYVRDVRNDRNYESIERKLLKRSQTAFPGQNVKKVQILPPFPTSRKIKSSRTRLEDFQDRALSAANDERKLKEKIEQLRSELLNKKVSIHKKRNIFIKMPKLDA